MIRLLGVLQRGQRVRMFALPGKPPGDAIDRLAFALAGTLDAETFTRVRTDGVRDPSPGPLFGKNLEHLIAD